MPSSAGNEREAAPSGNPAFATFASMDTGAGGGAPRKEERRTLLRRLRGKYRLLLIDDRSFEERFSVRLSRLNVLLIAIVAFTLHGLLVTALIVLTPLKRYIPGYSDQETMARAYHGAMVADSLEAELAVRDQWIANVRNVLRGELPVDSTAPPRRTDARPEVPDLAPGRPDSLLRAKVEGDDAYDITEGRAMTDRRELAGVFLFPPLRGIVTTVFDRGAGHFGVDIVTKADDAVKACLDGTVTLASWTTDAGHVVQVQHRNDLVSVYKHNSVLLKKTGDRVRAGEAIAIVGNSGELTSGPHLHFELWLGGEPVDPQAYMVLQ